MSIKEIAMRAGFKSQSHFSSLFKAHFGATPRSFRQTAN
jgi:AraC-like DNA-binding protein